MAIASLAQDTAAYQQPPVVPKKTASVEAMASRDSSDWERYEAPDADMSFWDFLDVINPLQHIPVVNTAYRHLTGDSISPSARVMGGMLYGGPIGGMAAVANAAIEQRDGQDIGDQLYAALGLGGDDSGDDSGTAIATANTNSLSAPSPATVASNSPADLAPATAVPASLTAPGPIRSLASAPPALTAPATANANATGPSLAIPARITAPADGQTTVAALEGRLVDGRSPPSKMPLRDTPLASSSLARHGNSGPTVPASATTGISTRSMASANLLSGLIAQEVGDSKPAAWARPQAPAQARTLASDAAPGQDAAPADSFGTPVPTEFLSDVMLRNLSKYEHGRRAAETPADGTASVRLSS